LSGSGSEPSAAVGVYSADFRDHVNARDYHGHDGIRRSRVGNQIPDESLAKRIIASWIATDFIWGALLVYVLKQEQG
jgi:hypothetical protein